MLVQYHMHIMTGTLKRLSSLNSIWIWNTKPGVLTFYKCFNINVSKTLIVPYVFILILFNNFSKIKNINNIYNFFRLVQLDIFVFKVDFNVVGFIDAILHYVRKPEAFCLIFRKVSMNSVNKPRFFVCHHIVFPQPNHNL